MQRFKKEMDAKYGTRHYGARAKMSSPSGKFDYFRSPRCKYAQWRNEHVRHLSEAAMFRMLRAAGGAYFNVVDARIRIDSAMRGRVIAGLVWVPLS